MKYLIVACALAVALASGSLAGASTHTVEVQRVVRPHLFDIEVLDEPFDEVIRVKLAGVVSPLGHPDLYWEAMDVLRDDLLDTDIVFDFALGYSSDEEPWVGYLMFEDEERGWVSVNEALIESGYARVDQRTAGENHLPYLLALEEEARENAWGVWEFEKLWRESSDSNGIDCPGCIIR